MRAKRDGNHGAITKALNDSGISTLDLSAVGSGCPDIAACTQDGIVVLIEAKMPKVGRLSEGQKAFAEKWPGPVAVASSGEMAVEAVLTAARCRKAGVK